jgi:3-methyl-2-oxobutanoate hydroxymethyltransferase
MVFVMEIACLSGRMERVTPESLLEMKARGEPIVMLSTYDYATAKIADECKVDVILVGDSLAGPVLGLPNTLGVTMEDMIHHTRGVSRGAVRAMVVSDMPFMSYQASPEDAVRNAGRLVREGGAQAVKVEGGGRMVERVKAIAEAGIPVVGHIGLTPQWILQLGGYRVVGKVADAAKRLVEDAAELERAGAFCIIIECVPWQVGKAIAERLKIPVIGCGAGPHCDGQVVVLADVIGMSERVPKFVKRYAEIRAEISDALSRFRQETKERRFPDLEHSYSMPPEEEKEFASWLESAASLNSEKSKENQR